MTAIIAAQMQRRETETRLPRTSFSRPLLSLALCTALRSKSILGFTAAALVCFLCAIFTILPLLRRLSLIHGLT
jgi:hypothetical protein